MYAVKLFTFEVKLFQELQWKNTANLSKQFIGQYHLKKYFFREKLLALQFKPPEDDLV